MFSRCQRDAPPAGEEQKPCAYRPVEAHEARIGAEARGEAALDIIFFLNVRRGQTELSIAMAEMAGINPSVTICEMLDDESGYALSKADAKKYAKRHNLVFVEGNEVLERWEADKHRE